MSVYLSALLIGSLAIGMPVAFGVGAAALIYFLTADFPLTTIPQKLFTGMDSPAPRHSVLPLAGSLMNHGGITRRLVDFASTLVGHIYGGLGHVTIVANVIMSGMSGTAAADAAATGSVLIPEMTRKGYSPGFASAISARPRRSGRSFRPRSRS